MKHEPIITMAGIALGLIAVPQAVGAIPTGPITIELQPVAAGLTAPVGVTHAGDGSGRLFIFEQSGQIQIVENGVLLPTPFLDISAKLPVLNPFFDERGLLGLAFHPNYATNGRFFVRYSAPRARRQWRGGADRARAGRRQRRADVLEPIPSRWNHLRRRFA